MEIPFGFIPKQNNDDSAHHKLITKLILDWKELLRNRELYKQDSFMTKMLEDYRLGWGH